MSTILQIETATQTCSIAISENGRCLALKEETGKNIHAANITLFIEEVLESCNKAMSDLSAVAISMGPGSYTGLRIGVSTAKGLCYALDIPLIAVNTLSAMVSGFKSKYFSVQANTLFCPMIDARRMEVYCAVFDGNENELLATSAKIIDGDSFSEVLENHTVYFFGDGAEKCEDLLGSNLNARVMGDYTNSARDLTTPAFEKFNNKEFVDVAYFEPFYLKEFIAGIKKA